MKKISLRTALLVFAGSLALASGIFYCTWLAPDSGVQARTMPPPLQGTGVVNVTGLSGSYDTPQNLDSWLRCKIAADHGDPMKKKQRKSYTAAFKVKIALEAIKGQRTINEIATHYDVHPNQVTQWKKQAIESLPDVFSTQRERDAQGEEALRAELYQQIGQLKVELDWLKKKAGLLD